MSLPFYCIVPEVWGKEKKTVNTGLNSFSGPRTVRIELLAVFFLSLYYRICSLKCLYLL